MSARHARLSLSAAALAAVIATATPAARAAAPVDTRPGPVHLMRPLGVAASAPTSIVYHGGPLLRAPQVYVDFWGSEWQNGFSSCADPLPLVGQLTGPCYGSAQVQAYVTGLISSWGGSLWRNTDTQYCQSTAVGAADCYGTAGNHVANPSSQFGGSWVHAAAVAATPSQPDVATEAVTAMRHFHPGAGSDTSNVYMLLSPPGKLVPGSGTDFCGYHSYVAASDGGLLAAFAYIPFIFNTTACGLNFVNSSDDSFGHGYMDGLSMVAGHEVSEAETDPGLGDGWTDPMGTSGENGDKCNFDPSSANVTLGGNYWALQPVWSDQDPSVNPGGSCAMSSRNSLGRPEHFITNAYVDLLARAADPDGLDYWANRVFSGAPRNEITQSLAGSVEYRTTLVNGLYQHYLSRAGDPGGVAGWVAALGTGATDESIAVAFISSDEYFAVHGGNNGGFINGFYEDVLGRPPDGGASYWVGRLNGGLSRGAVASGFLASFEHRTDVVNGIFQHYLGRAGDPGGVAYWVDQLGRGYRDETLIAGFVASNEYFAKP